MKVSRTVKIVSDGAQTSVLVDGVDLSPYINKVSVSQIAGSLPVVVLHVVAENLEVDTEHSDVFKKAARLLAETTALGDEYVKHAAFKSGSLKE